MTLRGFKDSRFYWPTILIACVIGAFVLGRFTSDSFFAKKSVLYPLRAVSNEFKFTNPLLAVGDSEIFRDTTSLEKQLSELIKDTTKKNGADSVSVYWKDLKSVRWAGINENALYAPASMLKVALLMTYLKLAESQPDILSKKIIYKNAQKNDIKKSSSNLTALIDGETYTIADLLKFMIIKSDNEAKGLLQQFISNEERSAIFNEISLKMPGLDDQGDIYSPKEYSIFFRILYNSTYLTPVLSEAALNLLSQTEYKEGLAKGVPKETVVSHKFGIRIFKSLNSPQQAIELHDCGIIYFPKYPYFLCVMTKGSDEAQLQNIIQNISSLVYKFSIETLGN